MAALLIILPSIAKAQSWSQKANCPGPSRTSNVNFTINGKLYVALGYSGTTSTRFNDLWEYDPTTNVWSQKANFPGSARYGAVAFVINGKAYVGTGSLGGGAQLTDFYEYNPTTNTWAQKANFGGGSRDNAAGFSIGNKGYLSCGYSPNSGSVRNDLWEYDPSLNTWTAKANLPGAIRNAPLSFEMNGEGYVGWGYNGSGLTNDLYKYNQLTNAWTLIPNAPANPQFVFCNNNKIYACPIITNGVNNVFEFDQNTNTWNNNSVFPGQTRYAEAGIEINGKSYIYGGGPSSGVTTTYSDLWEFSTCTGSGAITVDGPTTFCAGNSVNLTSNVVGGTYQWRRNGVNISTNATSRTYKATSTGTYTCVATCNGTALTSNAIAVTSKTNAAATVTASGATSFCAGDSVTLNATNLGSNYSVQWYRTNVSIENATNYSQIVKQPGTYKVVTKNLTNGCSRISSSSAVVAVNCRLANPDVIAADITESDFVAKGINEEPKGKIYIYPNPTSNNKFTVELMGLEFNGNATLEVYNALGQILSSEEVNITNGTLNRTIQIDEQSKGQLCLVRLIAGSELYDSKVILK